MKNLCTAPAVALGAAFLLSLPSVATAAEPFTVTVSAFGMHGPADLTVGGNQFLDLIDQIINAEGAFRDFEGFEFGANLDYLGVSNAIFLSLNASGTEAFLEIPSIGFNEIFVGGSRAEVEQQVEDWFKAEGADTYADFLASIAKTSPVAVTDGNPTAATASSAETTFAALGFTPIDDLVIDDTGAVASPNYSGFGLGFNSGQFKAGDLTGSISNVSVPFRFKLSERLSLAGSVPMTYLTLEGAKVYGLGFNLALPYRARVMTREQPMNWRFTPVAGMNVRASSDLASGAALFTYGVVNSIDYRINRQWILCVVNQLTGYQSLTVTYDDYEFDPNIDQLILKTGLRAVTKVSARWVLDGYLIDTRFLQDAAIEQFWTLGLSGQFKLTKNRNLQLGFNYDFGDDFSAWSFGLSSAWKF